MKQRGRRIALSLSPAEREHVLTRAREMVLGFGLKDATVIRILLLTVTGFDPERCGE